MTKTSIQHVAERNETAAERIATRATPSSTLYGSCVVCETVLSNRDVIHLSTNRLVRCDSCGSWTYLPRPSDLQQNAVHDTPQYFDHPYFRARRQDKELSHKRCGEIFSIIHQVADVRTFQGERLLDVGCDTGSLLMAAAECYGVLPMGLDVSCRAAEEAQARGLQVFHGSIAEAPTEFSEFKIITAVDVLEHVAHPAAFLVQVRKRMAPGGLLYVQMPNIESVVYKLGRLASAATGGHPRGILERLFPQQHLQYFSLGGFRLLAERCGFEVSQLRTRILPGDDIVSAAFVRAALTVLQAVDSWLGREILLCAVLRKAI